MSALSDPELAARVASGSLAAVAFGFATFQRFIEPRSEYRRRIKLLKERCVERQAESLVRVVGRIRQTVESDESFRTDDLDSPDVASEFCRVSRQLCSDMIRLDCSKHLIRWSFFAILVAGGSSCLLFAVTFLFPDVSQTVTLLSVAILVVLLIAGAVLNGVSEMLDWMENDG